MDTKLGDKTMTNAVDLFADIPADSPVAVDENVSSTEVDSNPENSAVEENSKPIETVTSVPEGAVSVTEFASLITQKLMVASITNGGELDGTEYTVPQAVYQTVKAQRDPIPHVLVKGENDKEARTYILTDEAIAWWLARRDKLATRGSGAKSASSRTSEDNLNLLGAAVAKVLYANSRLELWKSNLEQANKLVEKYKGFLSDAKVESETVESTIQEATDAFALEQAAKAEEKAKKKTSKTPESE